MEAAHYEKSVKYSSILYNMISKSNMKRYLSVLYMICNSYYKMRAKYESLHYLDLLSRNIKEISKFIQAKPNHIYRSIIPNIYYYIKIYIKINLLNNNYQLAVDSCLQFLNGDTKCEKTASIVAKMHYLLGKCLIAISQSKNIEFPFKLTIGGNTVLENQNQLFYEGIHQYKISSKIYNQINDIYHHGKLLNLIIKQSLNYIFVPVVYQKVPIEKALLIVSPEYNIECDYKISNIESTKCDKMNIKLVRNGNDKNKMKNEDCLIVKLFGV